MPDCLWLGVQRSGDYPACFMHPRTFFFALVAMLATHTPVASAALHDAWRVVPAKTPADSVAVLLRTLESRSANAADAAGAAFALGQFHYSRGEYAQAREAFARAGQRLGGSERGETRYWLGLTYLGLAQPAPARVAFEEAARSAPARRALARLGVAQALEAEGRGIKAIDELRDLLAGDAAEAGPAALSALASLAERSKHAEEARQARARLLRAYPTSVEAARLTATPLASTIAQSTAAGAVIVQIGAYSDMTRANAMAEAARKAGFPDASVNERPMGPGRPALFVVRLGGYADGAEARAVLVRAERQLGVAGQVVAR